MYAMMCTRREFSYALSAQIDISLILVKLNGLLSRTSLNT